MKALVLLGVVLIGAGTWVVSGRARMSRERNVLEIGEFRARMDVQEPVPAWIGVAGIAAGVACLLVARRPRR